jgi:hypothetical protein
MRQWSSSDSCDDQQVGTDGTDEVRTSNTRAVMGKNCTASTDLLEGDFRGEGWLAGLPIQGLRANPACRADQASRFRYSRGRGLKLTCADLLIGRVWSKGPGPGPSLVQWMLLKNLSDCTTSHQP